MTASIKRNITILSVILIAGAISLLVPKANAALNATNTGLQATANATSLGGTNTDILTIIGKLVDVLVGTLGVILFVMIIWGGIQWMIARGDPKKAENAQKIITNAVIGTLIILSSYALASFTIEQLSKATDGTSSSEATTT